MSRGSILECQPPSWPNVEVPAATIRPLLFAQNTTLFLILVGLALIGGFNICPRAGHACGHNLITTCAVSAFLGCKSAIESSGGTLKGKVVLLGTPAEESGGGKVDLINKGAFKDIDCALMAHPSPGGAAYPKMLAWQWIHLRYHGINAHASVNPQDGRNALDAQIQAFSNVGMMRQQIPKTWHLVLVMHQSLRQTINQLINQS